MMSQTKVIGIIPARYASSRFPGKPLAIIHGKTMIRRVYEQAMKSSSLSKVLVATDDDRIKKEVEAFDGEVVLTSANHQTGTDRCAEALMKSVPDVSENDIVINIQGDEPFIDPEQINHLADCFRKPEVRLATLVKSFYHVNEITNPNTIKVVCDNQGYALYFSRLPIPFVRDSNDYNLADYLRHIGIYGYRVSALNEITKLKQSPLEEAEKLEQLRWLENGYKIMTARSEHESWSIDTPEDLKKVKEHFSGS
jgi:3-deoxy-manno-octulosonate cytidylyltransferase (CMP-KDO synthetase)